jgi:hypothetical protein
MDNDRNYRLLLQLDPPPTIGEAVRILIDRCFRSISGLSRKIKISHTAISSVLAGKNLPAVRREILRALNLTINPWES